MDSPTVFSDVPVVDDSDDQPPPLVDDDTDYDDESSNGDDDVVATFEFPEFPDKNLEDMSEQEIAYWSFLSGAKPSLFKPSLFKRCCDLFNKVCSCASCAKRKQM
jgi:hypothetical protein